ncbi:MAG TPA: hypothetical protein VGK26_00980 [Thermoanaerobaculia bacterium]|jgi:hypothetical protein
MNVLDRLILADVAIAVVSMAASTASGTPPPHGLAFVLWLAVCASTVAAWILLLWRFRAARALYAASWAGYLVLVLLRGGVAPNALEGFLELATGLVGGMILALIYLSEHRREFLGSGAARAAAQPAG